MVDQNLIWLPHLRQVFAKDLDSVFEGKSRQVKIYSNGTDKGVRFKISEVRRNIASYTRLKCTG